MMALFRYVCPVCEQPKGCITNTRGYGASRRIECRACNHRWTDHGEQPRPYDGFGEARHCARCNTPSGSVLNFDRLNGGTLIRRRMMCRHCWDRWNAYTFLDKCYTRITPVKTTRDPPGWWVKQQKDGKLP